MITANRNNTEPKLPLEINVFSCRETDPATVFPSRLSEKHETDYTTFLVIAGGHLSANMVSAAVNTDRQLNLFLYVKYRNRKHCPQQAKLG